MVLLMVVMVLTVVMDGVADGYGVADSGDGRANRILQLLRMD